MRNSLSGFQRQLLFYVFLLFGPTKAFYVGLKWLRVAEWASRSTADRVMNFSLSDSKAKSSAGRDFHPLRVTQEWKSMDSLLLGQSVPTFQALGGWVMPGRWSYKDNHPAQTLTAMWQWICQDCACPNRIESINGFHLAPYGPSMCILPVVGFSWPIFFLWNLLRGKKWVTMKP